MVTVMIVVVVSITMMIAMITVITVITMITMVATAGVAAAPIINQAQLRANAAHRAARAPATPLDIRLSDLLNIEAGGCFVGSDDRLDRPPRWRRILHPIGYRPPGTAAFVCRLTTPTLDPISTDR